MALLTSAPVRSLYCYDPSPSTFIELQTSKRRPTDWPLRLISWTHSVASLNETFNCVNLLTAQLDLTSILDRVLCDLIDSQKFN